jgi:hypothetical protein
VDVDTVEIWSNGMIAATQAVPASQAPLRLRARVAVSLERDAFVVVVARGDGPLAPYVSTSPDFAATPIAITNPIWVDADGNGRFDPPGPPRPLVPPASPAPPRP